MKKIVFTLLVLFAFNVSGKSQQSLTIQNEILKVEISTFGAELQSIQDNNNTEYLWQGDPEYWAGRAPVMFPVCVKFKDQHFTYKGREFEMPDMGLAKISNFTVVEKQLAKVVLELKSNAETLKYYPFPFVLRITYEVIGNRLNNTFEVKNTGSETMYFALGGHPGFRFPFKNERAKNQYTFSDKLKLKRTEIAGGLVQQNQIQWLKNEAALPLCDARIPDAGMFVKNMPSRKIGVGVVGGDTFVEVDLGDFPNVNLWSPPGKPYACIEPMLGHHDLQDTPLAIDKKSYLQKLQAGESKKVSFSISVKNSKSTEIHRLNELKTVLEKVGPGEIILLADGIYREDEGIILRGKGTNEKPVIIKAKNQGKAVIQSPLKMESDFVLVKGLLFNENGRLEISGRGNRVERCEWNDSKAGKWLRVLPGSSETEIAFNTFRNKITSNQTMNRDCQLLQVIVRNENEKHHIHHNLFKDVAKGKTGNGFETLQLITEHNPFDPPGGHCNSVIEKNLFVRCNGESEIISVKSNGNLIRQNTFNECRGGLVLRHGDDNVAVQNYFLGGNENGSAGIRIQGTGQVVANNYFENLGAYGLGMMDGTPDDLYIRVERAQVLYNTFVNCNKNFVIGINHSKHPNGTVPKDCRIVGNIFYWDKKPTGDSFITFVQNDQPENWEWQGNMAFGKPIPAIEGLTLANPALIKEKTFYLPTSATPKIGFPSDVPDKTNRDLFGNFRKENSTIGAVQYPVQQNLNPPLTEKEVGSEAIK